MNASQSQSSQRQESFTREVIAERRQRGWTGGVVLGLSGGRYEKQKGCGCTGRRRYSGRQGTLVVRGSGPETEMGRGGMQAKGRVCCVGGTIQSFAFASDDILESRMRTWATLAPADKAPRPLSSSPSLLLFCLQSSSRPARHSRTTASVSFGSL